MTPVEFSGKETDDISQKTARFWINNCPVLQTNLYDEEEDKILFTVANKNIRPIAKYCHFTY